MASEEIVVGPAEVYIAEPGTAFPAPDAAPGVGWTLVGSGGSLNYGEAGITLRRNITNNPIRVLGSTVPRKNVISEMTFEVEFPVMDLSPEELAVAYGVDPADVTAGAFDLNTSPIPLQRALLVRADRTAQGGLVHQWNCYAADQVGGGEGTFSKTAGFATPHVWSCIEDDDGNFVEYATAEAGS
jgi:hypothetical protein